LTSLFAGAPPQNAGDVPYDAAWGGTPKAHTKDPTPVSAENNSLGKKGAIASGDSFEEYMRKRAGGGGAPKAAPAPAAVSTCPQPMMQPPQRCTRRPSATGACGAFVFW
jgi:hypothetical protein